MTEEEFKQLRADVEKARSEATRAQGSLDEMKSRLKKEFNVGSLKEAKAMLKDLQTKRDNLEKELDKLVEDYQREWHQNDE